MTHRIWYNPNTKTFQQSSHVQKRCILWKTHSLWLQGLQMRKELKKDWLLGAYFGKWYTKPTNDIRDSCNHQRLQFWWHKLKLSFKKHNPNCHLYDSIQHKQMYDYIKLKERRTPFRPIYSAIWPLAIAPTMAPTFDKEPNKENWNPMLQIS